MSATAATERGEAGRALARLTAELAARLQAGQRFAGLVAGAVPAGGVRLSALVAGPGRLDVLRRRTARRGGVLPDAHPGGTGGVLVRAGDPRPVRAGSGRATPAQPAGVAAAARHADPPGARSRRLPATAGPRPREIPAYVAGPGLFTIPHGPVRSGVFESVEYLVETPGEDIPHLHIRPYYKHRGLEKRFEGMPVAAGVLLAERVEGIASVAHALAYSHAVESLTDVHVPLAGQLVRVLHAELERLANHLDVAVRLAEAAGLAVAQARFGRAQGTGAAAGRGLLRQPVRPRGRRPRRQHRAAPAGPRRPAARPGPDRARACAGTGAR